MMDEIKDFEGRIAAALARIETATDSRAEAGEAPEQASADQAELAAALAAETSAKAALEERVAALKTRQDEQIAKLTKRAETQQDQLLKLDAELQSLRASNIALQKLNADLRAAMAAGGLTEALEETALKAELEALVAQRSADAAEVDAILAELTPLIAETDNAPG